MTETLVIQFIAANHYVALTSGAKATAVLKDPVLGRAARPNAYSFSKSGPDVWVGNVAMVSELAGAGEQANVLSTTQLADDSVQVAAAGCLSLDATTALSLIVRKAFNEAALEGGVTPQRIWVVLDQRAAFVDPAKLAWMLYLYCPCEIVVEDIESAIEEYMRARCATSAAAIAVVVLESQAYVAHSVGGAVSVLRVQGSIDFRRLREDLFKSCGAEHVEAWAKERLWREFVAWLGSATESGAPFEPHAIDVRLFVGAWSLAMLLPRLEEEAAALVRAVADQCAGVPEIGSLWLVSEPELAAFWQYVIGRKFSLDAYTVTIDVPERMARDMAAARSRQPPVCAIPPAVGLMLRRKQGEPKEFVQARGDPALAAHLRSIKVETSHGQARHKLDVVTRSVDGAHSLVRSIEFEHKVASEGSSVVDVVFDVSPGGAARLRAVDADTREILKLCSSKVSISGDRWISGPEILASYQILSERAS